MFYFHHTDRNQSIKSHIVTLNSLEKRMLIYVLDFFDGVWGGWSLQTPPSLNPPLMTAPYNKELNNIWKGIVFIFQIQKMYMDLYNLLREYMNAGCFPKTSCVNVFNFVVSTPPSIFPLPYTPLQVKKNRPHFCSSLIEMTTGVLKT